MQKKLLNGQYGDFISGRGNIPCVVPAAMKSLARDHSLAALSPPRAGNPQTWSKSDVDTQSWGDPGYKHTVISTPIAAAPNANRERNSETRG